MVIRRKHKVGDWLLSRISPGYRIEEKHMSALRTKLSRYFIALATVAVAFTARFMLEPVLGDVAQLMLFCLSVVMAAWHGGLGPGLLATAVSALLAEYFFIEPLYSFHAKNFAERIELILFLGIGVSISALSQARLSAEAKRQQLLV